MTKDDDTAALIAETRERSKILRVNGATIAADTIDRLAAALERATADAARMREALENIAWATPEKTAFSAEDLWAVLSASAIAALEPRHD